MQDVVAVGLHGIDDLGLAAVPAQQAAIAGLAAAGGIEDRAIEPHAALFDGGHGGVGFFEVGVLTEEFFDHGGDLGPRQSGRNFLARRHGGCGAQPLDGTGGRRIGVAGGIDDISAR